MCTSRVYTLSNYKDLMGSNFKESNCQINNFAALAIPVWPDDLKDKWFSKSDNIAEVPFW